MRRSVGDDRAAAAPLGAVDGLVHEGGDIGATDDRVPRMGRRSPTLHSPLAGPWASPVGTAETARVNSPSNRMEALRPRQETITSCPVAPAPVKDANERGRQTSHAFER